MTFSGSEGDPGPWIRWNHLPADDEPELDLGVGCGAAHVEHLVSTDGHRDHVPLPVRDDVGRVSFRREVHQVQLHREKKERDHSLNVGLRFIFVCWLLGCDLWV